MVRRFAGAEHARRLDQPRLDEARAAIGVDQAGREGAGEDDQHRPAHAGAEPQRRERDPGDRRDEAQAVEQRGDDVVEPAEPAHQQAERHADQGREQHAIGVALEA